MYSSLTGEFLFGVIEDICEVSLVQRSNWPFVKDSIDRLLCIKKENEEREIVLCEMKVRVTNKTAQVEITRIYRHHNEQTFVSIHSSLQESFDFVSSSDERIQILHHYYTYGKKRFYMFQVT